LSGLPLPASRTAALKTDRLLGLQCQQGKILPAPQDVYLVRIANGINNAIAVIFQAAQDPLGQDAGPELPLSSLPTS
jgi:hypothetical protein